MRAQASDPDLEETCRGHDGTVAPVKFSLRNCGIIVHAKDALHRKAIEQSIGDDLPAAANFFRGLKDQVGRAFELSARGQISGCSEQHGGVSVMAAGMHDAWFGRRVRHAGFFWNRQGIDIRAQADRLHRRHGHESQRLRRFR